MSVSAAHWSNRASQWCEILPLHMNVKACTHTSDGSGLTLYLGRKFYQTPDDAYQISYQFSSNPGENYFWAMALAEQGPLGTSDYHIEIEAIPSKNNGQSFLRIFVSNHQSWLSSKAMDVYLATNGKEKQGVSITGYDSSGNPIYSSGAVAAAERNLLRYYFAFDAYFDALDTDEAKERHARQLNSWFEKTADYPQLHELEKQEYMEEKSKERRNQIQLQQALGG